MCGLFGLICANPKSHFQQANAKRNFLSNAMYLSAFRGWESTGLAHVGLPNARPQVFKRAVQASDFWQMKATQRLLQQADTAHAMLGHCRSSTRGLAEDDNAHPFQVDHITLIHNGTVHGLHDWVKGQDLKVDSHELCYAFAKSGDEKKILEEVNGDYCVVWHNSKTGTFNIARNERKPLFWAYIPEWEGMAYMSEQGALAYVLERHDIKIEKGEYWYPEPYNIYSWSLGERDLEVTITPFEHMVARARGSPRRNTTSDGATTAIEEGDLRWAPVSDSRLGGIETAIKGTNIELVRSAFNRNKGLRTTEKRPIAFKPTGRQVGKARDRLKDVGLVYNTAYGAVPRMFMPYKNQPDFGFVVLTLQGSHYKLDLCEIHNVPRALWRSWLGQQYILAKAVNLKINPKTQEKVIILAHEDKDEPDYEVREDDKWDHVFLKGPEGELISRAEWEILTANGCAYCSDPLDINQAFKIVWIGNEPMGLCCAQDPGKIMEVKNIYAAA